MKVTTLVSLLLCFLLSCNNEKTEKPNVVPTPGKSDDTTELSEGEVEDIYSSVKANNLLVDSISKYTISKNLILKKDGVSVPVLTTEIAPECKLPEKIGDLNAGTELKLYKFDHNMGASATAMGFSGEIGKKQMLFIQDFVRYEYINCKNKKTKVGIGLRCYIHVTSFKGKIGFSKLTGIAANVELGKASCTYELKSIGFGIDGSTLVEGLNPQGDYNVENFGKLAVTFNNVLKLLNGNSKMIIRPVELP